MPVFMDRHYVEGATRHAVADAHQKDLAIQDKYDVKFLTYWFDDMRCTAFCLVEAPNRETIERAHNEAHGLVPNEALEVDTAVVDGLLGQIKDPLPMAGSPGNTRAMESWPRLPRHRMEWSARSPSSRRLPRIIRNTRRRRCICALG